MLGFIPIAHVPMLFGAVGALSSLSFRPFGLEIALALAAGSAAIFLSGLTVGAGKVLLRIDQDWRQASAPH
jgi:hypothetical protein